MVVVGILVCTLAWGYVQYFLKRPIGSGPAGPPVSREPFVAPWTNRPVHILGLGDSITAGLGARTPAHTYFRRVIKNPDDEFEELKGISLSQVLPHLSSENLAVSGSTSLHHEDAVFERLVPQPSEVFGLVFMTTGGNDIIHNYGATEPREGAMYGATLLQAQPWIKSFEARLERVLDRIVECFPGGCEIYLADIYDPTDGVGDAPSVFLPPWDDGLAIHSEYNHILRSTAAKRKNVFLVPLHAGFLGHGSHCRQFWRSTYDAADPFYWFYENIEDPNNRGYDAIRRIFLNCILENSSLVPRNVPL